MRILLYGLNYAPELTGIGKFSGDLCAWLAERGHEVRVISAPPYYPQWVIGKGYRGWTYRSERLRQVTVFRAPLWVPKRQGSLLRLIHLSSFALSSLPVALSQVTWRPDVVLSVAPALFTAPVALVVARLSGAKALLHFQDFEIDAAFGLGLLKAPQIERIARWLERHLLTAFDRVSTISMRMEQRLWDKGVPKTQTLLFPNWVDCEAIRHQPRFSSRFRKELQIPDGVRIAMYSGAMGEKQGLETVVEAARRLANRQDILFVLAGSGAARERLEPQTRNSTNIRWLPLQPESALNDWLALADVHLLPQRAGAADMVMPSKLAGMLASGRPVITMAEFGTQLAEVIGDRLGVVADPGDGTALAVAIEHLCIDDALSARLGMNARQYALEHYERTAVLERFETELSTFTGGATSPKSGSYDS